MWQPPCIHSYCVLKKAYLQPPNPSTTSGSFQDSSSPAARVTETFGCGYRSSACDASKRPLCQKCYCRLCCRLLLSLHFIFNCCRHKVCGRNCSSRAYSLAYNQTMTKASTSSLQLPSITFQAPPNKDRKMLTKGS